MQVQIVGVEGSSFCKLNIVYNTKELAALYKAAMHIIKYEYYFY